MSAYDARTVALQRGPHFAYPATGCGWCNDSDRYRELHGGRARLLEHDDGSVEEFDALPDGGGGCAGYVLVDPEHRECLEAAGWVFVTRDGLSAWLCWDEASGGAGYDREKFRRHRGDLARAVREGRICPSCACGLRASRRWRALANREYLRRDRAHRSLRCGSPGCAKAIRATRKATWNTNRGSEFVYGFDVLWREPHLWAWAELWDKLRLFGEPVVRCPDHRAEAAAAVRAAIRAEHDRREEECAVAAARAVAATGP